MTLGQMLNIYNQQIGALTQKFAPSAVPQSGSITVTGLDVAKQAIELFPPNYTLGRSWQSSLGVQRDLGHDLVLTADWARRQGSHFNLTNDLDINHTNWFVNGVAQDFQTGGLEDFLIDVEVDEVEGGVEQCAASGELLVTGMAAS